MRRSAVKLFLSRSLIRSFIRSLIRVYVFSLNPFSLSLFILSHYSHLYTFPFILSSSSPLLCSFNTPRRRHPLLLLKFSYERFLLLLFVFVFLFCSTSFFPYSIALAPTSFAFFYKPSPPATFTPHTHTHTHIHSLSLSPSVHVASLDLLILFVAETFRRHKVKLFYYM